MDAYNQTLDRLLLQNIKCKYTAQSKPQNYLMVFNHPSRFMQSAAKRVRDGYKRVGSELGVTKVCLEPIISIMLHIALPNLKSVLPNYL